MQTCDLQSTGTGTSSCLGYPRPEVHHSLTCDRSTTSSSPTRPTYLQGPFVELPLVPSNTMSPDSRLCQGARQGQIQTKTATNSILTFWTSAKSYNVKSPCLRWLTWGRLNAWQLWPSNKGFGQEWRYGEMTQQLDLFKTCLSLGDLSLCAVWVTAGPCLDIEVLALTG